MLNMEDKKNLKKSSCIIKKKNVLGPLVNFNHNTEEDILFST